MNTLLIYFLKVNFAFVVLHLFYRLFLQRDTFFREKRFALLLGYLFAVLHPLIDISAWILQSQSATSIVQTLSNTLPEIVVTDRSTPFLGFWDWAIIGYAAVTAFLLLRILVQTGSVLMLALHHPHEIRSGRKIVRLNDGTSPFSFYGMIFLNPDPYSEKDLEEILHHESAHVRQLHTLDVLLAEIASALFWINPFVWLLNRCLRENLEFLADRDVLHKGFDSKSYQYHLLRLTYQTTPVRMANHFNVSELKNRIVMMNKKKTSLVGLAKYTLSLPLFALLILVGYACQNKEKTETTPVKSIAVSDSRVLRSTKAFMPTSTDVNDKNYVYATCEKMPQFPGGDEELLKFIHDNLHYPTVAAEAGIEGRVTIRFVVNRDGDVANVTIIRGLNPSCNMEAVRVVEMMPKWIPGRQNGRNVPVYYTLPVVYKLQK